MRFNANWCWIMMACVLCTGCVGTKPVHYYTLGLESPQMSPGRPNGMTILVGHIVASEPLQDARIRYRAGDDVGAYEYHQWADRPADMVREGLVRALRAGHPYQHVFESASSTAGDYLVRGRLYEFDEVDSAAIQTRISLDLDLIDKKTNQVVWDQHFEHQEPANGKSMEDVVASMDRNLAKVTTDAAAGMDRFLAAQH